MDCVGYIQLYKRSVIPLHKYCSFLMECSIFVYLQNVNVDVILFMELAFL